VHGALRPDEWRPRVARVAGGEHRVGLQQTLVIARIGHGHWAAGLDGIARERELLRELRGEADLVIDTSARNVHELRATVESAFGDPGEVPLRATVMSFGFKYGLPVDADLIADVRFLPNPHWVPELRPHTGQDPEVSGYVLSQHGAKEFLDRYAEVLNIVTEGYRREGKRYMTLAVGCTGGKHRSVAMSEQIAARLSAEGVDTVVVHRDAGRE